MKQPTAYGLRKIKEIRRLFGYGDGSTRPVVRVDVAGAIKRDIEKIKESEAHEID